MDFLAEYEFQVDHRQGADNRAADYPFHAVPGDSSLAFEYVEGD